MAESEAQEKSVEQLEDEVLKVATKGLSQQQDPTQPDPTYIYGGSGRTWNYYKSIDWPQWWDEFNGAVIPKKEKGAGRRKYKSVWHFICTKTKVRWQQQALWLMIGPDPKPKPGERLRCPYLGDWDKRRRNGFYVFEDPAKIVAVVRAIQERRTGLDATQALAPMIARRLAYWYKIQGMLTEAFAGKLLDDEVSPMQAQTRINLFLKWQGRVETIISKLEDQWARIHGVNPMDPTQQYLDMALMSGKVGAAAALTGAVAAGHIPGRPKLVQDGQELPLPDGVSYDAILMADMLKSHSTTFDLPLPEKMNAKQKSKTQ